MGDEFTEVEELLNAARQHIDGEVDSRTPEYRALDQLERAMTALINALRIKA